MAIECNDLEEISLHALYICKLSRCGFVFQSWSIIISPLLRRGRCLRVPYSFICWVPGCSHLFLYFKSPRIIQNIQFVQIHDFSFPIQKSHILFVFYLCEIWNSQEELVNISHIISLYLLDWCVYGRRTHQSRILITLSRYSKEDISCRRC